LSGDSNFGRGREGGKWGVLSLIGRGEPRKEKKGENRRSFPQESRERGHINRNPGRDT